MGFLPDVPVLHGSLVRLEPLSPAHAADLEVAVEEDRAAYGFTVVPRAW
jgi:N-acetyltransferase